MAAEVERQSRSHPRLQVASAGGATLVCEKGTGSFEIFDVSMAGISFLVQAGPRPPWLHVGRVLPRVVVELAGAGIHGESVITHVTPLAAGALLIGARLYPATEGDHDALTTAVVRLERDETPAARANVG